MENPLNPIEFNVPDASTKRQRDDEASLRSARWSALLENIPSYVLFIDAGNRIKFASRMVPGMDAEKVPGSHLREYTRPEEYARIAIQLEAVFSKGEAAQFESEGPGPNGSVSLYSCRMGPIRNQAGSIEEAFIISTDVTSFRQIQAERQRSTEQMRMAIEAAKVEIWHWDVRKNNNTAAATEAHRSAHEQFLEQVVPEDRPELSRKIKAALEGGDELNAEFRKRLPGGAVRWIATRGRVVRAPDGTPLAMSGVEADISPRKQMEEERRRLDVRIQNTQKLDSLGSLAGGIAHDFNNLLSAILGNASLAKMDLPSNSPALPSLNLIETAARRAAELCRQMLAYAGKGNLTVEPVALNSLLKEMGELLKVGISKRAQIQYELAPSLPNVLADATQLRQIFLNLLTNAAESLPEQGGEIIVRTGSLHVNTAYLSECLAKHDAQEGLYVFGEVRDNGSGMSEEVRARIFDPFYTTKFAGRGLGLAAVLGIVRGHRGALKLESAPGRGSAFRVLLPALTEGVTGARPAPSDRVMRISPAALEAPPKQGLIMVVDDEEAVRWMASGALRRGGYEALEAADGLEALKLFKARAAEIRAVLLDQTMPGMNGAELFEELRRIQPDVRVIFSSGFTEMSLEPSGVQLGLVGLLPKPYTARELLNKLEQVLKQP